MLSVLLWSCASTGSPSGGPKDNRPPALVIEESPANLSTNYKPEKIELVFDEWIELKNQSKEILISPPFFKNPKISQRGKKVTIEFPKDEPLREDATYTLNFGEAIVDFTEGNPAKGFQFLFATGDNLDSLKFKGSIVSAYDNDPVKDVLIMLYDILGDSVVISEKPFYYARADDNGEFSFEYLKNDTFKLMVIEDINLNYLLDDEVERVAFLDSTFMLNDSSDFKPELRLFQPEQSVRIISSNSKVPGLISTVFNKKAENIDFSYLYPQSFDPIVETVDDTLKLWFDESIDSVGVIFGLDTLDFTIKPFDSIFYNKLIVKKDDNLLKSKLAPFDSLVLSFSSPIASIDTSLISLSDRPVPIRRDSQRVQTDSLINTKLKDTLLELPLDTLSLDTSKISKIKNDVILNDSLKVIDSIGIVEADTISFYPFAHSFEGKNIVIEQAWLESHDYQITILPGGIIDIYGRTCDTIKFDFKTNTIEDYGNINLTVSGMDSLEQYIVILFEGDKKIQETSLSNLNEKQINYNKLPASKYSIHLIKDENRDNKWTTGDYWKGRQPELVKKFDLEQLRANWDLEANISWDGSSVNLLGSDSTSVKLDSLGQSIDTDIEKPSNREERRRPRQGERNNKGLREGGG